MARALSIPLLASLSVALMLACEPGAPAVDRGAGVVDDGGVRHVASPSRQRIVSLVPAVTETLVALGAGDLIVARTRYDDQPSLEDLPSVGGGLDPSLEFLVDLEPDLIVTWKDPGGAGALSHRIQALGLSAYQVNVQQLEDFRRHARNLGLLTDREANAVALVERLDRQLAEVAERTSGAGRPTVLYLAQRDPPMGAGPGTFVDSLLVTAGAENVLRDRGDQWPLVSMEHILWRDPDYIVVPVVGLGADTGAEGAAPPVALDADPGWSQVPAVVEGRVVLVDAGLFGRPGPRMGDAARALAARLHPGAFHPPEPEER